MEIGQPRISTLDDLRELERAYYAQGAESIARIVRAACDMVETAQRDALDSQAYIDDHAVLDPRDFETAKDKLDELICALDPNDCDPDTALRLATEARQALDV